MGVIFWVLLIGLVALVVLLVRGRRTSARDSRAAAVGVLEERYARGEITREDFLERRTVLGGNSRATNRPKKEPRSCWS
jgi:putative membrane protein